MRGVNERRSCRYFEKKRDMTADNAKVNNAKRDAQNMPSAFFAFFSLLFKHVCMGHSGKTVNKLSSLPILCTEHMRRKDTLFTALAAGNHAR